jgi:hypothetical protein
MRRNQTNNQNRSPMKKKQKLDGSDLLIESRLIRSYTPLDPYQYLRHVRLRRGYTPSGITCNPLQS